MDPIRFSQPATLQSVKPETGGSPPDIGGTNSPSFADLLEKIGSRLDAGERLVDRAITARPGLDGARLIALQAGIYRYTETVDLAAKLVDRVGSGIKTILQGQ